MREMFFEIITPLKEKEKENRDNLDKLEASFKQHLVAFYELELEQTGPLRQEVNNMKLKIEDYVSLLNKRKKSAKSLRKTGATVHLRSING